MRKLMALAIGLLFTGATTSWALFGLEDVSYDGSLEVVGVSENNTHDEDDAGATSDRNGYANTRVFVGLNAVVTEGVKARLAFSRTGKQYGQDAAGNPGGTTSIDEETALISIHNAFVDFEDLIFGVGARLGRQEVGNAGDLVWNIAPTDNDALSVAAIDGLLLTRNWEVVQASYFTGKSNEDDAVGVTDTDDTDASTTNADINLNSFDLVFPTLIPGGKINLGYLWGVNSSTAGSTAKNKLSTIRLGINGGFSEDMITYRAEYLQNSGTNKAATEVDYGGNAIDLGVGFNSAETAAGTFNLGLGLLMASGDDNTGDTDDDAFHDFSILGTGTSDRIMGEIFGKSRSLSPIALGTGRVPTGGGADTGAQGQGLEVLHLMAKYTPTQILEGKLNGKIDFFAFDAAEDGTQSANPNGDSFGTEIDLTFGYNHSENVGIEFGYAMFSPGDGYVNLSPATNSADDDITKLFARTKIKWGGEAE